MKSFDHIIIGTGQATGTLLGRLLQTGESIAVIEGGKVGGSCVNYGCTPTKTLVASAKAYHQAKRGEFFGFTSTHLQLDFARVMERMNEIRGGSTDGFENWLQSDDRINFYQGWGTFQSEKEIKVGEETLSGAHIYLNTGTKPFLPPIEGIQEVPWMDSAGLLDLDELPDHLLIIGGGYIGVEFAQIFKRFGSEVTIIQGADQLMPREDADVAHTIQTFLEEEGISIRCNTRAEKASQKEGNIQIQLSTPDGEKSLTGSHLLVAAGRRPNTEKLNLEAAVIHSNKRGFIETNDHCQTNVESIFAVGDVNGKGAFTHTSVNDAEVVLDFLYGGRRKVSSRQQIYALFTDPPLGRVGMSEKEALESGRRVMKATREMKRISRAKEMGETKGFIKILVDADTDHFLGVSVLGVGGDEVINMFAPLIQYQMKCKDLREVVFVHPTVSELIPWILDDLELIEK